VSPVPVVDFLNSFSIKLNPMKGELMQAILIELAIKTAVSAIAFVSEVLIRNCAKT
jgi:hypothetical protein